MVKSSQIEINEEFNKYVESGRIEFITFHPSYSYEEFIEGITVYTEIENRPTDNLKYVLKSGLFKIFCTRALLAALGEEYQSLSPDQLRWSDAYERYQSKKPINWEKAQIFVLIIPNHPRSYKE